MAGGGSEDPTVLMKISLTFEEFDWPTTVLIGLALPFMPFLRIPKKDK
jgi:hypothetical protein